MCRYHWFGNKGVKGSKKYQDLVARKNTLEALLDPEAPPMANYAAAFTANSDAAQAETEAKDEVGCQCACPARARAARRVFTTVACPRRCCL